MGFLRVFPGFYLDFSLLFMHAVFIISNHSKERILMMIYLTLLTLLYHHYHLVPPPIQLLQVPLLDDQQHLVLPLYLRQLFLQLALFLLFLPEFPLLPELHALSAQFFLKVFAEVLVALD